MAEIFPVGGGEYEDEIEKINLNFMRLARRISDFQSTLLADQKWYQALVRKAIDGTLIPGGTITSSHIVDGTIVGADIANNTITRGKLSTAEGIVQTATGVDVTMNDYSFFPNFTQNGAGDYSGTDWPAVVAGDYWIITSMVASYSGGSLPRFRAMRREDATVATQLTAAWRYLTASDNPTVWVSYRSDGEITSVWFSDDPLEGDVPGVLVQGQESVKININDLSIIPVSAISISKGAERSSRLDIRWARILSVEYKNPAKAILDYCRYSKNDKRLILKKGV